MSVKTISEKPTILFMAGFGDNSSMFDGLMATELADEYHLRPIDLPGFGTAPLPGKTTLASLAKYVNERAQAFGAEVIMAHSVASIIASLAATERESPLKTILSLEGNITPEDAYFSGTAADYSDPAAFRAAFLDRLAEMKISNPVIERYSTEVLKADPKALWELGCDAREFSDTHHPGTVLTSAAGVTYFFNPENCPKETVEWLEANDTPRIELAQASHWASIDQPHELASAIVSTLS